MTTFEKQLVEMWKSTNNISSDEDIAFFNSILPAVRRLDFERKYYFRSQVLQLLVGINQDSSPTQYQPTSALQDSSASASPAQYPYQSANEAIPSTSIVSPESQNSRYSDTVDSFVFDFTKL